MYFVLCITTPFEASTTLPVHYQALSTPTEDDVEYVDLQYLLNALFPKPVRGLHTLTVHLVRGVVYYTYM
jgi:hypothetical protein